MAKPREPGVWDKSPLNEAVGEWLKRMRSEADLDVRALGEAFDLSDSYVRAIESGLRALPSYAAIGLIDLFGLSWSAASSLLTVTNFIDVARANDMYSPVRLRELIQRVRGAVTPDTRYAELLDFLLEVQDVRGTQAAPPSQWTTQVSKLADAIQRAVAMRDTAMDTAPLFPTLSPVFRDLIDTMSAQLELFPPHVNAKGIQAWERKNRHRIRSLLVYLSEPDFLLGQLERAGALGRFDWEFLSSGAATVRVLIPGSSSDAARVQTRFLAALAGAFRKGTQKLETVRQELAGRVEVRSAGVLAASCTAGLLFDFFTRGRATTRRQTTDAQREFPNAWVYELGPELYAGRAQQWIGFLMDQQEDGYAVAMNQSHIDEWRRIFDEGWGAPVRSEAAPPTRARRKR